MAKTLDVRSYCNPFKPRFTAEAQIAKLTGELYVENRKGTAIDDLIRSLRKGSVVEIVELGLLAPIKAKPGKRRQFIADHVQQIMAKGAVIREINTGWTSDKDLPSMMMRASDFIATSGKAGTRHGQRGNPIELTPAQRHEALMVWRSREYTNDKQRVAAVEKAIGRRCGRSWCWQNFGSPSGTGRPGAYQG